MKFGAQERRIDVGRRWLLLAVYFATCAGAPLPEWAGKDHRRPFPCQFSRCSCSSADDCARSCCCTAHASFLALETPAETAQASADCCAAHAEPAETCDQCVAEAPPESATASPTPEVELPAAPAWSARRCTPGREGWWSPPPAVPPCAVETALHFESLSQTALRAADEHARAARVRPPIPPPRIAA